MFRVPIFIILFFLSFIVFESQAMKVIRSEIGIASTVIDTIPPTKKEVYKGYRINVSSVEILKQKSSWIKIAYNITNTGRFPVKLGVKSGYPLIVTFDQSLQAQGLQKLESSIKEQILSTKLTLSPGQLVMNNELKISRAQEIQSNTSPASKIEQVQPTATDTIKAKRLASEKQSKPIETEVKADLEVETKKEVLVESKADPFETPIEKPLDEVIESPIEDAKPEEKLVIKSIDDSLIESKQKEEKEVVEEEEVVEDDRCADLIIESLKITKQSKKWVYIQYTIKNTGSKKVALHGPSKDERDNVAMKMYLSSSQKLSRGSLVLGGHFIPNDIYLNEGQLPPGESFTNVVKVDFRKRTRFTPYIIIELDNFQQVEECDERNNINIVLSEDLPQ